MARAELTKRQKRRLRELCGLAHERELATALGALEREFRRWRDGEVDAFDLAERVHRFHDGPNRELFKKYDFEPDFLVAAALRDGILTDEDVGEELLELLRPLVDSLRALAK